MIRAQLKKEEKIRNLGEAIWCIVSLNRSFKDNDFFSIIFNKVDTSLTKKQLSEYIADLSSCGLIMEFLENDLSYTVTFDLSYYNTYPKILSVITLFRAVFNKYQTEGLLKNYFILKSLLPELDVLQIYILSSYHVASSMDGLHSVNPAFLKPIKIETFKERFESINLHAMFVDKPINIKPLLKDVVKNKKEILNLILC